MVSSSKTGHYPLVSYETAERICADLQSRLISITPPIIHVLHGHEDDQRPFDSSIREEDLIDFFTETQNINQKDGIQPSSSESEPNPDSSDDKNRDMIHKNIHDSKFRKNAHGSKNSPNSEYNPEMLFWLASPTGTKNPLIPMHPDEADDDDDEYNFGDNSHSVDSNDIQEDEDDIPEDWFTSSKQHHSVDQSPSSILTSKQQVVLTTQEQMASNKRTTNPDDVNSISADEIHQRNDYWARKSRVIKSSVDHQAGSSLPSLTPSIRMMTSDAVKKEPSRIQKQQQQKEHQSGDHRMKAGSKEDQSLETMKRVTKRRSSSSRRSSSPVDYDPDSNDGDTHQQLHLRPEDDHEEDEDNDILFSPRKNSPVGRKELFKRRPESEELLITRRKQANNRKHHQTTGESSHSLCPIARLSTSGPSSPSSLFSSYRLHPENFYRKRKRRRHSKRSLLNHSSSSPAGLQVFYDKISCSSQAGFICYKKPIGESESLFRT